MVINSSSPAPAPSPTTTLSAVLGEDRRRERSHHGPGLGQGRLLPLLIPACGRPVGAVGRSSPSSSPHSQIMSKLHRWGTAFLPKSGADIARDLEARRRTPSPPPRPRASSAAAPAAAQALPRHEAPVVTVSVPERRPLREREEPAVREPAAGSKANAEADTSTGESAGSSERATSITPVGRGGGGTWLKASPKKTMRYLSLQTDISEEGKSPQSLAELPALVVATDDKFVWADKYRPNVLNEFICNKAVAAELYQLVVAHQCKHFIFEGPPAVGKRSMVLALIRDGFGPDDLKIEEQTKRFELKGEIRKHIDVRVKISGHHVEVNLADLHGYEKYSGCDKIIFCCSDASNLDAVKHLCKVVTLQPPSFDEMIKVLEYIATHESIYLPHDLARRITVSASNNLRQAIRSFEATWKANYPFIEGQAILTGWEEEISNLARNIMEEPSSKQLFVIRGKIRKLIEHDVSPHFIFSHLVAELKRDKDEEFQHSIDELALDLNHCKECKLLKGRCKGCKSREAALEMRNMNIEGFTEEARDHGETIQCFIMIEEFTVRFMSFYRSLVAKNSNRSGVQ